MVEITCVLTVERQALLIFAHLIMGASSAVMISLCTVRHNRLFVTTPSPSVISHTLAWWLETQAISLENIPEIRLWRVLLVY